jgi:hypothetical protein
LACQCNKSLFRLQRHPRHEMSVVFHHGAIVNQTAAARLSCKSIEFAHKRRNSNNCRLPLIRLLRHLKRELTP